jgi:asparaginyl-tRNA synthetase
MSTGSATPAVVPISKLGAHVGESVTLRGWLYNKRGSGKLWFLIVRDGTGFVQAVISRREVAPASFEAAERVTQESSLVVTGTVRADARAEGGVELAAAALEVVQIAPEYPIAKKEHGTAFLMEHRHLWLRSRRQHAVLRIRSELSRACRDYFFERDYVLIDSPILTPSAAEGTTTLFETGYFDEKAYLSQSGQLYLEPACQAFGKVFCFGPTFRAEKSKTRRHLTEFWMIEPEVAWASFEDVMDLAEDFLVEVVARVLDRCREDLARIERDTSKLEAVLKPFPRMHYDEAAKILEAMAPTAEEGGEPGLPFRWGSDFGAGDETTLSSRSDRPLMVHHFPTAIKAFYMKEDPERAECALGVDVLAPEGYGEVIGGGAREDDLDKLLGKIRAHGLPEESYSWYLDVRRYGSVPHGGFGMGLERALAWICGLPHVRETIPFPRMMNVLRP